MSFENFEKVSFYEEGGQVMSDRAEDSVSYTEDNVSYAEDSVSYAEDSEVADDLRKMLKEDMKDVGEDISEFLEDLDEEGEEIFSQLLPGSELDLSILGDDEEEVETDYQNDKDLSKFLEYVNSVYPSAIPKHDGTTMLGCEKAISFLDRLNSEISRAIREDVDDVVDVTALEEVRVSIMKDIIVLKDHLNSLKKKFKDHHKKEAKSDSIPDWKNSKGESVAFSELTKEATTPNKMMIAVSPFERALAGILINSHVSGGNSIEDVWEFLSEKYKITPREELAIMQVVMDMGFHIFKDRGTFSSDSKESEDSEGSSGIEFLKNYFN